MPHKPLRLLLVFLPFLAIILLIGNRPVQAFPRQGEETHLFLPLLANHPAPAPAPSPTPQVHPISCAAFPDGPTDVDWAGCVEGGIYEIQRHNVSFTMVACCGTGRAHYAIELDARLVQGEGDYRIGFDIRSFADGGGYLFGVNPRNGTYALERVDGDDWKAGVPLVAWTESPHIRRDMAYNRLRVERHDAMILLSINGEQVAAIEDSTHQEGFMWSLYARNYHQPNSVMHFEDIQYLTWP